VLRFSKTILWFLAVLLGAYVIACVAANLWLQSARVQERLRAVTSEALGIPVSVGRAFYFPWSGVTLRGIRAEEESPDSPKLTASDLRLRFELLPLLQKQFRIQEIRIIRPLLTWKQSDDGRWRSRPPAPVRTESLTAQPDDAARPAVPTPPPTGEPASGSVPARQTPETFRVEVLHARISDGEAVFLRRDGGELLRVKDIQIEGALGKDGILQGKLEVDETRFPPAILLRDAKANFSFNGSVLSLTQIRAHWAGGKIVGDAEILPRERGQPFDARLRLKDIELRQLLADAGIEQGDTEGVIVGNADLAGRMDDAGSLAGQGFLQLQSGRIEPIDFVRQVGQVLQIEELQMLTLRDAAMKFNIRNQRFNLEDMTLKTDNLVLKASGPVRFDGKLDLDGRFIINEKIRTQLRGLSQNFGPTEDLPGHSQVVFDITGRLNRPKTNLLDRIVGAKLGGDVTGFLRGFFRAPRAEPKPPESEPSATSEGTPPAAPAGN